MPGDWATPRKKIIVLAPVRNEAWILEGFLQTTLAWADHIVVSLQDSNDGTEAILSKYPEVQVIANSSKAYNEAENRRQLLAAARSYGSSHVIISLDADERMTANIMERGVLDRLRSLPVGTGINVNFANVCPEAQDYWEAPLDPIGFVDDGREPDNDLPIHFPRTCFSRFDQIASFDDLKILHLQYLDSQRTLSKHRWYQMWEWIHMPETQPLYLFRKYHHVMSIPKSAFKHLPSNWVEGYKEIGLDPFKFKVDESFWWDAEAAVWLRENKPGFFSRVALDDYELVGTELRSLFDRLMFSYLRLTQPAYKSAAGGFIYLALTALDRILAAFWKRNV